MRETPTLNPKPYPAAPLCIAPVVRADRITHEAPGGAAGDGGLPRLTIIVMILVSMEQVVEACATQHPAGLIEFSLVEGVQHRTAHSPEPPLQIRPPAVLVGADPIEHISRRRALHHSRRAACRPCALHAPPRPPLRFVQTGNRRHTAERPPHTARTPACHARVGASEKASGSSAQRRAAGWRRGHCVDAATVTACARSPTSRAIASGSASGPNVRQDAQ